MKLLNKKEEIASYIGRKRILFQILYCTWCFLPLERARRGWWGVGGWKWGVTGCSAGGVEANIWCVRRSN